MVIPKDIEPIMAPPKGKKRGGARGRRRPGRPFWPAESSVGCPICGGPAVERITPYSRTIGCRSAPEHFDQVFSKSAGEWFGLYDPNKRPGSASESDRRRNKLYVR